MKDVTPGAHATFQAALLLNALLGVVGHVFIGYLVGAAFSEHIFMDLSQTHWNNLWTYFWIFFWPFGLAVVFWFWFLMAALILGGLFLMMKRLG